MNGSDSDTDYGSIVAPAEASVSTLLPEAMMFPTPGFEFEFPARFSGRLFLIH